jgi:phosphoglycolate phosphatase
MKKRIKLIIFDWDGTLFDSIDWIVHCIQHAARECDCVIPDQQAAKDIIGLEIMTAIQTLFPDQTAQKYQQLISSYAKEYALKQIGSADFFDGVYDMLIELKALGFQLAVATGKKRQGLQHALSATNTENLFTITRCADETASKPDPKMLLEIMHTTGYNTEQTLMVGDSIHDLRMANNAKIMSVGVTCGAHTEELLRPLNPVLCLDNTAELLTYFR